MTLPRNNTEFKHTLYQQGGSAIQYYDSQMKDGQDRDWETSP